MQKNIFIFFFLATGHVSETLYTWLCCKTDFNLHPTSSCAYKYRSPALSMKCSCCLQYFCCISSGCYGLMIIASLNKYFFHGILTRRTGSKEQGYEECKTVQCLIYLIYFFRFNRDLNFWFLWSFVGLQSVPYWRSYHGYQQKKGCCIKHQMWIIGEAGMLSLTDCLLWV